jgi:hypothetical protein
MRNLGYVVACQFHVYVKKISYILTPRSFQHIYRCTLRDHSSGMRLFADTERRPLTFIGDHYVETTELATASFRLYDHAIRHVCHHRSALQSEPPPRRPLAPGLTRPYDLGALPQPISNLLSLTCIRKGHSRVQCGCHCRQSVLPQIALHKTTHDTVRPSSTQGNHIVQISRSQQSRFSPYVRGR